MTRLNKCFKIRNVRERHTECQSVSLEIQLDRISALNLHQYELARFVDCFIFKVVHHWTSLTWLKESTSNEVGCQLLVQIQNGVSLNW